MALLGYDETYYTGVGLYPRIGGAIACIFWINLGAFASAGTAMPTVGMASQSID